MLKEFHSKIESHMGCTICNSELICAITIAKDDVVSNDLILGKDVTSKTFEDLVCRAIKLMRDQGKEGDVIEKHNS